jgi:hypothetical protein
MTSRNPYCYLPKHNVEIQLPPRVESLYEAFFLENQSIPQDRSSGRYSSTSGILAIATSYEN